MTSNVRKGSMVVSPLCVHQVWIWHLFCSPWIDLREQIAKWVKSQWVTVPPPVILRWDDCGYSRLCIPISPWQQDLCGAIPQVESRPSVGFPIRLEVLHVLLPQRKGHMSIPSVLSDNDFHGVIIPISASLTASRKCWHTVTNGCYCL